MTKYDRHILAAARDPTGTMTVNIHRIAFTVAILMLPLQLTLAHATTIGVSWADDPARSKTEERTGLGTALQAIEATWVETDANGSSSKQIEDASILLSQNVTALILDPVDAAAASRISEEARSRGVPVIALGALVEDDWVVSVDFDYRAAGRAIATSMIAKTRGQSFLVFYEEQRNPEDNLFLQGQLDVLKPAASAGAINLYQEAINPALAPEIAKRNLEQYIFTRDYQVDAVIAPSGEAAKVIADSGVGEKVIIGAPGSDIETLGRINSGRQMAGIWLDRRELGKAAVEIAMKMAMGESINTTTITIEEPDRLVEAFLLEPLLVTDKNLQMRIDAGWLIPPEKCRVVSNDMDICAGLFAQHRAVPVLFGTDRRQNATVSRVEYNDQRSGKLQLGLAWVTVPEDHRFGVVERPASIHLPLVTITLEKEDPKAHFTIASISTLSPSEFQAYATQRVSAADRNEGHALVFVHGFNVKFEDALYSTAQFVWDMQFDGLVALYSWPSKGTVKDYFYDVDSARQSRDKMSAFLDLIKSVPDIQKITLVAHSMGSAALIEALADQASRTDFTPYDDIIFAAPDVDADDFASLASRIITFADGVTLYASSSDRALRASKSLRSDMPRAGDSPSSGPLILKGIDTIDATAVSNYVFGINHSYFANDRSVVDDIAALMMSGIRPPDRRTPTLRAVSSATGAVYWQFPK